MTGHDSLDAVDLIAQHDAPIADAIRYGVHINHTPMRRLCMWRYPDGHRELVEERHGMNPTWVAELGDGRRISVSREGGEVNARIVDPGGDVRTAWDTGTGRRHHPLGRSDHWDDAKQATDAELAFLNLYVRPIVLADTWDHVLERSTPCDHLPPCERNKQPEAA